MAESPYPFLGAAYSDINALRTDPANIQRWVDLGVDLTSVAYRGTRFAARPLAVLGQRHPGQDHRGCGGEGAASAFNDIGVVAQVSVIILGIPAVAGWMHDHGMTLALMTCSQ